MYSSAIFAFLSEFCFFFFLLQILCSFNFFFHFSFLLFLLFFFHFLPLWLQNFTVGKLRVPAQDFQFSISGKRCSIIFATQHEGLDSHQPVNAGILQPIPFSCFITGFSKLKITASELPCRRIKALSQRLKPEELKTSNQNWNRLRPRGNFSSTFASSRWQDRQRNLKHSSPHHRKETDATSGRTGHHLLSQEAFLSFNTFLLGRQSTWRLNNCTLLKMKLAIGT